MRLHADRPHAGTAAAMGNAEGLVEIEVANIRAQLAGSAEAYQRVHIGAIQIDLAAMIMNDRADIADRALEHPVCRGIGDHQRREMIRMRRRLRPEIIDIDIALLVASDHDHAHTGHMRARRIGAMGG